MFQLHISGVWLVILGTMFVVFAFAVAIVALSTRRLFRRLRSQDAKLDTILKHLGIDWRAGLDEEVRRIIRDGNKGDAIKMYRDLSGLSFNQAAAHVERLDDTYHARDE